MQSDICLVAYCRPGFEKECGAEITDYMQKNFSCAGFFQTQPNAGFIVWKPNEHLNSHTYPPLKNLIFSRQVFFAHAEPLNLPETDRATPIAQLLQSLCRQFNQHGFSEIYIETADTNEGKELSRFCKSLVQPILKACEKINLKKSDSSFYRAHIFLPSGKTAFIGIAPLAHSSPFEMGIIRLKFPNDAPSRSTLKLEEAFHTFLTEDERRYKINDQITAVDIGSSPGGWTYQFVKVGAKVTAIDNGKMDQKLMDSGLVTHINENGLTYLPRRMMVNWMVCDMIETPARVCEMAVKWFERATCEQAVVTLKLPMKKRYEEVKSRVEDVKKAIKPINSHLKVKAKHLYHNRDEVTLYIGP